MLDGNLSCSLRDMLQIKVIFCSPSWWCSQLDCMFSCFMWTLEIFCPYCLLFIGRSIGWVADRLLHDGPSQLLMYHANTFLPQSCQLGLSTQCLHIGQSTLSDGVDLDLNVWKPMAYEAAESGCPKTWHPLKICAVASVAQRLENVRSTGEPGAVSVAARMPRWFIPRS